MKIIIYGAPGAGKGSQADMLVERYHIPHISTGDILRQNIKEGTPVGKLAKEYIDKGELVPDEVILALIQNRLQEKDCEQGYLFDGFPRTLEQAKALDRISKVDAVLNLNVDLALLMNRLTGRRTCSRCGQPYHVSTLGGSTKCAKCGGELVQRADDTESTVSNRLQVYLNSCEPLLQYYRDKGVLYDVDGNGSIAQVTENLSRVLDTL